MRLPRSQFLTAAYFHEKRMIASKAVSLNCIKALPIKACINTIQTIAVQPIARRMRQRWPMAKPPKDRRQFLTREGQATRPRRRMYQQLLLPKTLLNCSNHSGMQFRSIQSSSIHCLVYKRLPRRPIPHMDLLGQVIRPCNLGRPAQEWA